MNLHINQTAEIRAGPETALFLYPYLRKRDRAVNEFLMQTYTIALPVLLGYIVEYHSKYTQLGDIPSYAYQNFCEMYEAYHALGGNGMVTKMKQEIDELHIKKKGD